MQSVARFIATYSSPTLLTIIFFTLSIAIHEFGHFIAAKLCGLYVPIFSIGFGKKLYSTTIWGTQFCLSLFPFGGYVSIPQLSDIKESELDAEAPKGLKKVSPIVKIFVSATGPVFNIIFAIGIAFFLFFVGLDVEEGLDQGYIGYVSENIKLHNGTEIKNPFIRSGIQPGDLIMSIDGNQVHEFNDIFKFISLGTSFDEKGIPRSNAVVFRQGSIFSTNIYPLLSQQSTDNQIVTRSIFGIRPKESVIIKSFMQGDGLDDPAIISGDQIVSANGKAIYSVKQFEDISAHSKKYIYATIQRNGEKFIYKLTPQLYTYERPYKKPYIILNSTDPKNNCYIIPDFNNRQLNQAKYETIDDSTKSQLRLFFTNAKTIKHFNSINGLPISSIKNIKLKSIQNVKNILNEVKPGQNIDIISVDQKNTTPINISFESFEYKPSEYTLITDLYFNKNLVKVYKAPKEQISQIFNSIFTTLHSLVSPQVKTCIKDMIGPVGLIKQIFQYSQTNFSHLLFFVMLININLAIFNLLPLPILDGGHIAIGFVQLFIKSDIVEKIFNFTQYVFFFLLLSLTLYVTFLDCKRINIDNFKHKKSYIEQQLYIVPE